MFQYHNQHFLLDIKYYTEYGEFMVNVQQIWMAPFFSYEMACYNGNNDI